VSNTTSEFTDDPEGTAQLQIDRRAERTTDYHQRMQLRLARLCLDCEEIHDQQSCPICSSESFAYITRWIPRPDGTPRQRQPPSRETAEVYRELISPTSTTSGTRRWAKRGAVALGAVSLAGWIWRQNTPSQGRPNAEDQKKSPDLFRPNDEKDTA
jgi:hypothetical protein